MEGIWNTVKSFLGIAPPSHRAGNVPRTSPAGPAASPQATPEPPAAASPVPAAPVISPTPQPTLAGVINGHRFAVGNRVHRLTGPALQRPAAEGILNAHRHAWKTRQTGVLNAHRHQWKPPFPEIINSQRHRWKPWILSRPGRES